MALSDVPHKSTRTRLEADELVSSPGYDTGVFPALRAPIKNSTPPLM
jgi:hypothetical protein